jgi:methionyl-tRNA synthetase
MSDHSAENYKRILVTSALPYANGPIHLGHLAGAYLPADVYVRYQRLKKRDVLFICGTDEHGVPIAIAAERAGVTPQQIVDKYWADHYDTFTRFGVSFDHFSRTSAPTQHKTAADFFQVIYDKGFLVERAIEQFFCVTCNRFLADRFVEGECPRCHHTGARGDQCEACGSSLEQTELINPYCKVCGGTPVLRQTKHLFLKLNEFQPQLEQWLADKKEWKENVLNYVRGWFQEGLGERAVTRDLSWGIKVPVAGYEDKVIYVWFEAPIGYVSATQEWAEKQGRPEDWKRYWLQPDTKLVHFIGKDNIVFHAVIWPAMLMGHGEFVLPADIPANEFLNIQGEKLSTSRNYAVWLGEYLEKFPPDPLRYYLAVNAPETKDADFNWEDFQGRNNSELADILGNFINRTLTFARKQFAGAVPPRGPLDDLDRQMVAILAEAPEKIGALLERYELRKASAAVIDVARFANKYFNDQEPWRTARDNREKCATTIHLAIQACQTLAVLIAPILPFSAEKIWAMLGNEGSIHDQPWDGCGSRSLAAGHALGQEQILFSKIEENQIRPEVERLRAISEALKAAAGDAAPQAAPAPVAPPEPVKSVPAEAAPPTEKSRITYDEFAKVDLRVARVLKAEKVEKADKLLRLELEVGGEQRQIVAGVAKHYTPEEMTGRTIIIVANLQPAVIRGIESNGMLLAAEDSQGRMAILSPQGEIDSGAKVK